MYRLLRPLFFLLDAERAHHVVTGLFALLMKLPPLRWITRWRYRIADERLAQTLWGVRFGNPVGLAAGFDKHATLYPAMAQLGFGSVEVGTVTALPQPGNSRPRLFRLPRDRALINRFGFNNDGARAASRRLAGRGSPIPLGVNIGRSKAVSNDEAVDDYLASLEALWSYASWVTVNVSSPNTPELRALQMREHLGPLLRALKGRLTELAAESERQAPPLLLKIAPDLTPDGLDDICAVVSDEGIDGVICGNTTIVREPLVTDSADVARLGAGGLSGPPLKERMLTLVAELRERLGPGVPIVAAGGIADAETAWRALRAGANLIQVYTGLVYEGPGLARAINRGLLERLEQHGLSRLADAVGRASAGGAEEDAT